MRTDGDEWQLYHLLIQDEIITDEVDEYVKQGIATATCQVTERFFIHQRPERRIEKVNGIDDQIFQNEGAKLIYILE